MQVQPYLFFDGRCDEAIEFYKSALGAEVTMRILFKDNPAPHDPKMGPPPPGDKVMHLQFKVGETTILASDGHCRGATQFEGFSLSLTVADKTKAEQCFAALTAGGKVTMPMGKTFFSPAFGMAVDRFGVAWMVYVAP